MECKNLAVLGMWFSGKTTMLNYLRGIDDKDPEGTSISDLEPFLYTKKNGEKVLVNPMKDIGGDTDLFKNHAEKLIKACSEVWFLFDVNLYRTQLGYKREMHHRLTFVRERCQNYHNWDYSIVLWGTHIDESTDQSQTQIDVTKQLSANGFSDIINKFGIEFINTTDF